MASTTTGNGRAGGRMSARAADTEARKRRILEAAVRLARQGGYDAVQMRDVASSAEVALGTLYRHYTSKDQLLLAVQLDRTETLRRRLEAQPPDGETAAERVADAMRRACKGLERDPLVTSAMMRAMFASEPDVIDVKRSVQEQLRSIIETAIRDRSGGERPDAPGGASAALRDRRSDEGATASGERSERPDAPGGASAASGGEAPSGGEDVDAVVDVLGHVWFAAIAFWVNGLSDSTAMADRLANAAQLLLE